MGARFRQLISYGSYHVYSYVVVLFVRIRRVKFDKNLALFTEEWLYLRL